MALVLRALQLRVMGRRSWWCPGGAIVGLDCGLNGGETLQGETLQGETLQGNSAKTGAFPLLPYWLTSLIL